MAERERPHRGGCVALGINGHSEDRNLSALMPEVLDGRVQVAGDQGADVGAMGEHEARHPDGSGEIAGPQGIAVLIDQRKLRRIPVDREFRWVERAEGDEPPDQDGDGK